MLTITEEPGLLVITAAGTLDREDYDRFVPAFERRARERGRPAMLIDATGLDGWDAAGGWKELKFDATHQDAFGPIAVLGDARWEEWGTRLAKPFIAAPMRYFRAGEEAQARAWLEGTGGARR